MDEELAVKFLIKKFKNAKRNAKYRAKKKKIDFNLTFDYLRDLFSSQDAKCFYSGLSFEDTNMGSLSLDRVDSNKGYTQGNVVWCRSGINFLKYTRTYEELQDVCVRVATYRPKWSLVRK